MPGPVGRAVEDEKLPLFEGSVDDGLGEVTVVEDIAPLGERRLVGGEDHGLALEGTFVDDVEEDVGGVVAVGEVTDLVDDEHMWLDEAGEGLSKLARSAGDGEDLDEL
jgi:hypothetical protein